MSVIRGVYEVVVRVRELARAEEFYRDVLGLELGLADPKQLLEEQGVATRGPVHHEWMPAKSLYFSDPDGHELEFCAPL